MAVPKIPLNHLLEVLELKYIPKGSLRHDSQSNWVSFPSRPEQVLKSCSSISKVRRDGVVGKSQLWHDTNREAPCNLQTQLRIGNNEGLCFTDDVEVDVTGELDHHVPGRLVWSIHASDVIAGERKKTDLPRRSPSSSCPCA